MTDDTPRWYLAIQPFNFKVVNRQGSADLHHLIMFPHVENISIVELCFDARAVKVNMIIMH